MVGEAGLGVRGQERGNPLAYLLGVTAALCLAGACLAAEGGLSVEAPPLFREVGGRLHQALLVDLGGDVPGASASDAVLEAELAGALHSVPLNGAETFDGRYLVLVPEVDGPTSCAVRLRAGGRTSETTLVIHPQRRWTVFFCHHTHMDIGFTDRQDRVWDFYADNLDLVAEHLAATADYPVDARFHWTCEESSEVRNYIERRGEAAWERLLPWVGAGQVEVCAFHLNELTELCGDEELVRALYYAQRLRDAYGVRISSAMIDDIPGYTWCLPMLFSQAGVSHLNLRANSIRGQFLWWRKEAPERLFHWESPDGSRVLCWYTESYRDGNFFRNEGAYKPVLDYITRLEKAGYPYNAFQLRMGGDNLPASLTPCHNVLAWNATWAYPRLVLGTNRDFFEFMERYAGSAPVYRGDIPDWWADGAASSARETSMVRRAHDLVSAYESLHALLSLHGVAEAADVDYKALASRAYDRMLLYDEHTWGANVSVREPYSEATREQWEIKSSYAEEASELAELLRETALARVASSVAEESGGAPLAVNPLPWSRAGVVAVGDEEPLVVEVPVPAMGWRRLLPHEVTPDWAHSGLRASDSAIENAFYRIEFDRGRGAVTAIHDRRRGVQIVDTGSPWLFGGYIHDSYAGDEYAYVDGPGGCRRAMVGEVVREAAGPAEISIERGSDDSLSLVLESRGPVAPSIRQVFTLYAGAARIDVSTLIDKEETLTKEAVYCAFPFALEGPQARVEIPMASMAPGSEQLPCSCCDFYSIQRWVDFCGADWGVTWVSLDAPLVEFSRITTEAWADGAQLARGTVFSYTMNNHWMVNYKAAQGGLLEFRYALTTHDGAFDPVAAHRFGWETSLPLLALGARGAEGSSLPGGSFGLIEVGPVSVHLQAVKRAEDGRGYILRLRELSGRSALALCRLPGVDIRRAYLTTLLEKDVAPLETDLGGVSVLIQPYSIATLRVLPSAE